MANNLRENGFDVLFSELYKIMVK